MELDRFFFENIAKILEFLDQDIITIYIKRTVDSLAAGYYLAEKFASTAQLKIADWPPDSGICLGFTCDGFYLHENKVGVGDAALELERPMPVSYLVYKLAKSMAALERGDLLKLYIGVYSWLVDNCEYKCEGFDDMLNEVGGRLSLAFPYPDAPFGKSLALTTLPVLPGVTSRGLKVEKPLKLMKPAEILDALDEALGIVYEGGFDTAVGDKGLRIIPGDLDVATKALELEAHLAGFVGGGLENSERYVEFLSKSLEDAARASPAAVLPNPYFVIKLGHYLPYYNKFKGPLVLRADVGRGFVASVVLHRKAQDRLGRMARRAAGLGQITQYPTHVLVYATRDKWPELLKAVEES